MTMRCRLFALTALFAGTAAAADIVVLSAGAVEPGLHPAIAAFERQTGHRVQVTFNTTPQIQKRIGAGDTCDVVIAPPAATKEFLKDGRVESEGVNLGRVGVGVVLRAGAPVPDLSTAAALKGAVLAADSLVINRASTGIYVEGLLRKLGVWGEVEPKTTRYPDGVGVMEHVLHGKGREFGFGAITEILLYKEKGLRLAGPLPDEIQNYTAYVASVATGGKNTAAARELVAYLASPESRKAFVSAGIE